VFSLKTKEKGLYSVIATSLFFATIFVNTNAQGIVTTIWGSTVVLYEVIAFIRFYRSLGTVNMFEVKHMACKIFLFMNACFLLARLIVQFS
jgi:hypothetical protein